MLVNTQLAERDWLCSALHQAQICLSPYIHVVHETGTTSKCKGKPKPVCCYKTPSGLWDLGDEICREWTITHCYKRSVHITSLEPSVLSQKLHDLDLQVNSVDRQLGINPNTYKCMSLTGSMSFTAMAMCCSVPLNTLPHAPLPIRVEKESVALIKSSSVNSRRVSEKQQSYPWYLYRMANSEHTSYNWTCLITGWWDLVLFRLC